MVLSEEDISDDARGDCSKKSQAVLPTYVDIMAVRGLIDDLKWSTQNRHTSEGPRELTAKLRHHDRPLAETPRI